MAKIKVTRFESEYDVTDEVNKFLAERDFDLSEVHIQFVTSRWSIQNSDTSGSDESLYEAYITHPA